MNKALLILVDGCRPDILAAAPASYINSLSQQGAWTYNARTVTPSITLPVHFSIFTSMTPGNHGVETNSSGAPVSDAAVGFFQWAKFHGRSTAMYYNWEFLRQLSPPGYLDTAIYLNTAMDPDGDMRISRAARHDMIENRPDFAFVYFGVLDEAGHAHGFESDAYIAAMQKADQAVEYLVEGLISAGIRDQYTILFQSDHGGIGHDHSTPVQEVMTIPWFIVGNGIQKTEIQKTGVSVIDTAPTLARCMGLPRHHLWQGKMIQEAFIPGTDP